MVKYHLQVHKTHVHWLDKFLSYLQDPSEGLELVQCSMARTKLTLFLLNLRFDDLLDSLLQYTSIDLTREDEECDSYGTETQTVVPLLENRNHHSA